MLNVDVKWVHLFMMMDLFVDTKYALLLKCYTNVKKSTFVFSIMLQNCNYLTPV